MWFELRFGGTALRCLVAGYGDLFWRLVDVGRLSGEAYPYNWAYKIKGTRRGRDVLAENYGYPKITTNCLLVSTRRVLELLTEPLKSQFRELLERGQCTVCGRDVLSKSWKKCVVLVPDGDVVLNKWIRGFVHRVNEHRGYVGGLEEDISLGIPGDTMVNMDTSQDTDKETILDTIQDKETILDTIQDTDLEDDEVVTTTVATDLDTVLKDLDTEMEDDKFRDTVLKDLEDLKNKMLDMHTPERVIAKRNGWWMEEMEEMPKKIILTNGGMEYQYELKS